MPPGIFFLLPGTTFLGASAPIGVVTVLGFAVARTAPAPPNKPPTDSSPTGKPAIKASGFPSKFSVVAVY